DRRCLKTGIALDLTRCIVAIEHGKLDVHENKIRPLGKGLGHPIATIDGLEDVVARSAKKVAQDAAQVFLVLNDKDALAHGAVFRNSARVGSSIWKVDPLPSVDSTQMRPPCISTICLAMASPRPVPLLALVFEPSI